MPTCKLSKLNSSRNSSQHNSHDIPTALSRTQKLTGKASLSGRPRSPLWHDRTASGTTWSRSRGWVLPCEFAPAPFAGSACGHHESHPENCAVPGALTGTPLTAYGALVSHQGFLDPLNHFELQTWLLRPHPHKRARKRTLKVLPECTYFPSLSQSAYFALCLAICVIS